MTTRSAITPYAHRPFKILIVAIADIVRDDRYLAMTEREALLAVMQATGGSANPTTALAMIRHVRTDAARADEWAELDRAAAQES